MSKMVARMAKMKADNLVGIGNHNQRKTKNHSNKDIDVERSNLNYDLVQGRTENYKTDIQKFIDDKKSGTRATRKDAVLVNEWIITSDKPFFDQLDEKETKQFFEDAKDYFAAKFGDDNVRYAQVHLDERTPHMHLGIVPFDKDNKLSAKRIFNRNELQTIQNELPVFLQNKGFKLERGEKGSKRKHLSVPEYKKMAASKELLKKDINVLEREKNALELKFEPLEKELAFKKNELINLTNEKSKKINMKALGVNQETINVKVPSGEKFFGYEFKKSETKQTGNIVLPRRNFEELVKMAEQNEQIKGQIDKYLKTDLVQKNKNLENENVVLKTNYQKLKKKNIKDVADYNELLEENYSLKAKISDLRHEIGFIYKSTKELFKERTDSLKTFKSLFNDLLAKIKEKTPKSEFERLNKREKSKEMDRGMKR